MIEEISPAQYRKLSETQGNWQLVDVRELFELAVASIAHAIHIPMGEIVHRHAELDKARPVAVLCKSGIRSARVAMFLAGQNFARVANVSGGIDAWALESDTDCSR